MRIYKQEVVDGLQERIKANASIAYCQPVTKSAFSEEMKSYAYSFNNTLKDDDLYITNSILVSTVWNLNDDIFDVEESWIARNSPVNKPDNNNHVERDIVGHMTAAMVVDHEGNVIPEDTAIDDLPAFFHIVNSGVIYTKWEDKEYQKQVAELIEAIEAGKKFVSMECRFKGFDYALMVPPEEGRGGEGYQKLIARNEQTAFLTKYLRAYGGEGEYQGHKIGRVLRNIRFSGKGYVDNPANPASIIFSSNSDVSIQYDKKHTILSKDGVYQLQMPKASKSISSKEFNDMNEELEKKVAELAAQVETLTKSNTDLQTSLKSISDEKVKLETELKSISEEKTTLATELATVRANEKKAKRVAKLVDGGVSKDVADAKVTVYETLSDEQFEVIATDLIEAAKTKKDFEDKFKKEKDKEKDAKCKSEDVLADVKVEEPVIVPQVDEADATLKTRASLSDMFSKMIASKAVKKNKKV
jgi:hypothetical protein